MRWGQLLQGLLEQASSARCIAAIDDRRSTAFGTNPVVQSLVVDGVLAGVGSVLSFLPIIVVLFLLLSILEDSGYMARVAFVMDKILRRFGLSGRSFVPMLVGFGCSVPAIMSTRTLPSEHDRKDDGHAHAVHELLGQAAGLRPALRGVLPAGTRCPPWSRCTCWASWWACSWRSMLQPHGVQGRARAVHHGAAQLPPAELQRPRCMLAWDKAKGFVDQGVHHHLRGVAWPIWFLQTFDVRFNVVSDQSQSMLARLGGFIAPVFAPLGFRRLARHRRALVCGLVAKESVISTLTVLLGSYVCDGALGHVHVPAIGLRVPGVRHCSTRPCVAAIGTVRSELGGRYAAAVFALQIAVAWVVAFIFHAVFMLMGLA